DADDGSPGSILAVWIADHDLLTDRVLLAERCLRKLCVDDRNRGAAGAIATVEPASAKKPYAENIGIVVHDTGVIGYRRGAVVGQLHGARAIEHRPSAGAGIGVGNRRACDI